MIECPWGTVGGQQMNTFLSLELQEVSGRWYLGWAKRRRFKAHKELPAVCFDEQKLQDGKRGRRCDLTGD